MRSDKAACGAKRVFHEFPPVYDERSTVLILGTIPSPRSRESGFYYMHPQNRFWKMIGLVTGETIPPGIEERKALCLRRGIALWDVLESCEIDGASDGSIRSVRPNDLGVIFDACDIRAVFTTGKKAHELYGRFFGGRMADICLPSTSPANRTISEEEMLERYMEIGKYL